MQQTVTKLRVQFLCPKVINWFVIWSFQRSDILVLWVLSPCAVVAITEGPPTSV